MSLALPGGVTALAAYRPGAPLPGEAVVVGYESMGGARLGIVSYGGVALAMKASYPLSSPATALTVANLDSDFIPDTAVVAGGELLVLHGKNAIQGGGQMEVLPVDGVTSVTAGEFLFDRHAQMQLSVVTTGGKVLTLAHQGFDSRPYTPQEIASQRMAQAKHPGSQSLSQQAGNNGDAPWATVEEHDGVVLHPSGTGSPILLRSRISGSGGDDLVVLNSGEQARTVISHSAFAAPAGSSAVARSNVARSSLMQAGIEQPVQSQAATSVSSSSNVVAALSMRVSADGRPGVVTLDADDPSPQVTDPAPNRTFYPNTFSDNSGTTTDPDDGTRCSQGSSETCTLRDAITFVNDDAKDNIDGGTSDTIMLSSGSYSLTWQAGTFDANGSAVTHLEVLGPVTIIGSTGTIIEGKNNDTIFTINPGSFGSFNPSGDSYVFDMTIENVTMENGKNNNNIDTNSNANNVGGAMNWDAYGTGNLTLTNSKVQNCTIEWGDGGGIWAENSVGGGTGVLTLTSTTVSNNATAEAGGGVYIAFPSVAMSSTNSTISSNKAQTSVNPSDPGADGTAGGLFLTERGSGTPQTTISGATISSNVADVDGGGFYANTGFVLSSSLVSNNSAGRWGGGVLSELVSPELATTITSSNILNNSATTAGGGILVGPETAAAGNSLQITLSRIFGNTSNGATGLANGDPGGSNSGSVMAKENWWGCNGGPSTSGDGCDQAVLYSPSTGSSVVSPYAQLGLSATTPTTINLGGTIGLSVTLNTDSSGNPITGAFPAVATNYPYTFSVTGVTADPIPSGTFNTAGTGTATLTPTSAGSGTVSATFDNQKLSVNFLVQTISTSLQITATPSTTFSYGLPPSITVQFNPSSASGITASDFRVLVDGSSSYGGSSFGVSPIGGNLFQVSGPFNLLPPTGHTLEVKFLGTTDYMASNSSVGLSVIAGSVSFGYAVSPTNPVQGQGGTITVTVAGVGSGVTPTGSITYTFNGGTTSNAANLTGGSAQITIPTIIRTGSQTLGVTYNGDSNYAKSTGSKTFTVFGRSLTFLSVPTSTAAMISAFGLGFTPPSGSVSFTDVTTGNPVAAPVTLNTSTATTALTPQVTTATGTNSLPVWTELADVNGDGYPDLIASLFGTDSVTVQLGNGDGTFGTATSILIAPGFGPAEVHAVSLRGNGTLDLIVGSFNLNEIAVLVGNGNGTFQSPVFYTVGTAANTPTSLTTGDFNRDGNLDVAVANTGDNTVSILLGNGTGALVPEGSPIPVGHVPEAIRAGDFNADGYSDLAVANYSDGTVTTFLNNQSGGFTVSTISVGSGAGSGPQALAINGSGSSLLLAVANFKDNTVSVMQSQGNGNFGAQTIVNVGKGPDDVNFSDFNGDGIPDLAVANYTSDTVNLVMGNAAASYVVLGPFSVGSSPYSAAVGDVNLDGTPDIAVPNCFSNNTGVLLDGTEISVPYSGLSLTPGDTLNSSYSPDSNSKYGPSTSANVTAP